MRVGRGGMLLLYLLALGWVGGHFPLAQEGKKEPAAGEAGRESEPTQEGAEKDAEDEKKKDEKKKKEESPEPLLETVTVTATRVETDLMKTPLAVTVVDQDTLDREGVQNVRDMADMVPNMDIATINGQSTPMIAMRGVRSTNETELGDPSVGVHLDGVYSPRMQGVLGLMFDNERVEVTRGPQGTLFGRNSTVGSINIVSAKPKLDAFDARLNIQYGNYNTGELQGMINQPISDTFALRFAGRFHQRDSYLNGFWDVNQYDQRRVVGMLDDASVIAPGSFEECTSPECFTRTQHSNWWIGQTGDEVRQLLPANADNFYMNAEEWAYRVSGLWQPKDDISLNMSFQHFRSDGAGGIDLVNCDKLRGRPVYEFDDQGNNLGIIGTNDCSDMFPTDDTYQAVVNVPGRLYLDIMYLRSQFTWDLRDNLRFVYIGGFEDQDRESAQDMEQSLNAWDGAMFFLPGTGSQSWSTEYQLQSYGNRRFDWIAGANYFHERTQTIGYYDNPIDEKALWVQPNRSTDAAAVFAQGTYSFTDRWHMTVGARYSDEEKEDKGGRTYICNVGNGCAPQVGREQVEAGLTGFSRDDLRSLPADFFENPDIYPEVSGNDNKGAWTHTDWRIGLEYERANTLVYSYLATGFKAGGIGDVFQTINPRTGEEIIARTSFEPEEVLTLEFGLKRRFGRKLNLSAAYFITDYENMQYASVGAIAFTERWAPLRDQNGDFIRDEFGNLVFGWVGAPVIAYFTQNVPGAEIQGLEIEYDWRPWNSGRIHGFATWMDTEITEDWVTKWNYDAVSYFGIGYSESVDPTNPILETNLRGNELAVSPPFSLRLTFEHGFVLPKKGLVLKPWVSAYWEDDSYLTIWNVDKHTDDMDFVILDEDIRYTDDRRKAWSMLHAGVRLYSGDWTLELYGYNLTNEVVQYWGGAAEQVAKGSFSVPRTYGIRIGYEF